MQYINHWPNMAEINLPGEVSQDVYRQLLEPFDTKEDATEFWKETFCSLIILDPTDNITALKESDVYSEIEFALTYTEYSVPLSLDYQLLVTIVNDSGTGIFLVIPPELSHIISN